MRNYGKFKELLNNTLFKEIFNLFDSRLQIFYINISSILKLQNNCVNMTEITEIIYNIENCVKICQSNTIFL